MSDFIIAVHSLVLLAHKNEQLNSKELADNLCVNSVRIRTILNKFVDAGLVNTKIGLKGGYTLNKDYNKITLADIITILKFDFIENSWYTGEMCECAISSGMKEYMESLIAILNDDIYFILEKITLKDVYEKLIKIKEEAIK